MKASESYPGLKAKGYRGVEFWSSVLELWKDMHLKRKADGIWGSAMLDQGLRGENENQEAVVWEKDNEMEGKVT